MIKNLLITAMFAIVLLPDVHAQFEMSHLYQHWIQSDSECSGDTFVYRPQGHDKLADTQMYMLYGGITIHPEGQFTKHRWKKCGNDTSPDFTSGSWKWKDGFLKIAIEKEVYGYQMLELKEDMFKAVIVRADAID